MVLCAARAHRFSWAAPQRATALFSARNEDNTTPAAPKSLRMVPAGERDGVELVSGANGFALTFRRGPSLFRHARRYARGRAFRRGRRECAHVAMSATESALANDRVLAFDPYVENGLAEDAMLTVVLPYVKTGTRRREAFGRNRGCAWLRRKQRQCWFADHLEAWYMEIATGHHWVAQRIPDDCIAVVANQLSIQEVDFESDSFIYSEGIREFVEEHALNSALGGGGEHPFNFREIFGTSSDGDRRYNTPRVWDGLAFGSLPKSRKNYGGR